MSGSTAARNSSRAAGILLVAIFLFHQLTIRDGHTWDDDVALYVLHARNLAEGRSYADTGYIFNPQYANLGPPVYPPGFPLLLAPIWAARGLDLNAMKTVGIVCFAGCLGLIYVLYRKRLGAAAALALVAAVGFCPALWEAKDFAGSDLPFLLFAYLAILAMEHLASDPPAPVRAGLAIAVLIAIAYSVRTAGLVLLPVLLCLGVWRSRRPTTFLLGTVLLAAALCGAEAILLRSTGAVPSLFRVHAGTALANVRIYETLVRSFWSWAGHLTLSLWLNGLMAALALIGCVVQARSREGIGAAEIFALLYAAMLLIYLPVEPRFLFPLIPVYLAAALQGAGEIAGRLGARPAAAACTFLAIISVAYASQYRQANWGPIPGSVRDQDFLRIAEFITNHTAADEVVLFRKPRFLALLTGRRSATYAFVPELGSFVRKLRPGIVVAAAPSGDDTFASDAAYLWPFLRANGSVRVVYVTPTYSVFRVQW